MDDIHWVSPRISYRQSEKKFVMVILPRRDSLKMYLLFMWLVAWTVAGLYILMEAFHYPDKNYRIFSFIYFFFWIYFEITVLKVFHWRKWGKEILIIEKGFVMYEKYLFFRKKTKKFDVNLTEEFTLIPFDEKNWTDFFTSSFWNMGKERIRGQAGASRIFMAHQLTDHEAIESIKKINRFLNQIKNRHSKELNKNP